MEAARASPKSVVDKSFIKMDGKLRFHHNPHMHTHMCAYIYIDMYICISIDP